MLRAKTVVGLTLGTLLLGGCGSSDAPVDAAAPTTAAPNPSADFTAAVPVGTNAAKARVQFRVGARPAAGQPLPVAVRVVPTTDVSKLQVFFETEPGLGLVDDSRSSFVVDGMKTGEAHAHELQVLPGQNGVFLLKITVMTDTDAGSRASEFAIPILVGTAIAPVAPAPAVAAPAPAG